MHKYVQLGPGPYVTPGLTSAVCPEKHVPYRPGISCNADVTCYISSVIKCDYITPPVRMYHGEREERKNKRERNGKTERKNGTERERRKRRGRRKGGERLEVYKCEREQEEEVFVACRERGEEGREAAFTSIRNLLPYPILKYRG